MKWYFIVLKKYTTFSGRAGRKEFWYFKLFHNLILYGIILYGMLNYALHDNREASFFESFMMIMPPVFWLYLLATFLPNLAVSVRRLHDINRGAEHLLLWLAAPVGPLVLFIFHAMPGHPGENRFGLDPITAAQQDKMPASQRRRRRVAQQEAERQPAPRLQRRSDPPRERPRRRVRETGQDRGMRRAVTNNDFGNEQSTAKPAYEGRPRRDERKSQGNRSRGIPHPNERGQRDSAQHKERREYRDGYMRPSSQERQYAQNEDEQHNFEGSIDEPNEVYQDPFAANYDSTMEENKERFKRLGLLDDVSENETPPAPRPLLKPKANLPYATEKSLFSDEVYKKTSSNITNTKE